MYTCKCVGVSLHVQVQVYMYMYILPPSIMSILYSVHVSKIVQNCNYTLTYNSLSLSLSQEFAKTDWDDLSGPFLHS